MGSSVGYPVRTKKPSGIHAELPGPGDFEIEVVGTSKYQRALDRPLAGEAKMAWRSSTHAILVFENDNPHDSSAVQVFLAARWWVISAGQREKLPEANIKSRARRTGRALRS